MLSNVEQNPSRKSRGLKIIDDMVFTIPVDKKMLKENITNDLNKLIWGFRYKRKIDNDTNIKELRHMLSKEDEFPDDYVFQRQDKLDFFDDMFKSTFDTANTVNKSLMFKVIRERLEHSRVNSVEFNYTRQLENIQNAISYLNNLEQEKIATLDNNMLFKLSGMYSQVREEPVFSPLVLQGKEVKTRTALNWFKTEKENILNQREVKLETLPKDYSDYLIANIIRESINYYIEYNTFAGYIARKFEEYNIGVSFYLPDANEYANLREAREQEQALFAFQFLNEELIQRVVKVKEKKANYTDEKFVELLGDTPENIISYFEKCLYGIFNFITIDRNPIEKYDHIVKEYHNSYNFFWKMLTIYLNHNRNFISVMDESFNYTSLQDVMTDYFKNIKRYKDESIMEEDKNVISLGYLTTYFTDKSGNWYQMIADVKTGGKKLKTNRIFERLSIKDELIHFSEMRNIIPKLQKYVLNTKFSPSYHFTNMNYLEYRHISNEAHNAVSKLIKKIDALQEKKPLNFQQRINETNSLVENILHGKKMLDKHLDAFLEMIAEFEKTGSHRRWRGLLGESKSYSEQLLRRLEQAGDSKKLIRNQLDWGATVLEFNKNYIPAIKYVHNEIDLKSGFFWEKLPFGFSAKERDTMGHCGNAGRNDDDFIYSLRRKYKDGKYSVHVTLTVQKDLGVTIECKGRGNATPIEEYWPYLVELFIRDEFIVCAESGLGHNPRVDFNINMSQDALDNKEKIEELKPYLFSKKKIVFEKFSDVDYSRNKNRFTANEILGRYTDTQENLFTEFFVIKKKKNDYIPENYERDDNVENGEVFNKYKNIIEKILIDHLVDHDLISIIYDEKFGEMYELEFTLKDVGFEGYKGRELFDGIAESENHTVDLSDMIEWDFGDIDFSDKKHRQIAIDFIKEEFSNGFIFLKFKKTTNDANEQKISLIEFDFYEFIYHMAHEERSNTWLASAIDGDNYIDNGYYYVEGDEIISTFKDDKIIKNLNKFKYAKEVITLLVENADKVNTLSSALEDLRSSFNHAINSLNDSDVNDQIFSKFSETIMEFVDYNPEDSKFYFMWDNIFNQIDDSDYDDDKNIASYTNFFDIVSKLYTQKYPRNRTPVSKVKDIYELERFHFQSFSIEQTEGKQNAERKNSALMFFINFSDTFIDWKSIDEFEPVTFDFFVTDEDKVSHFIDIFVDNLSEIEFTKEYLKNLKSLIK